METLVAQILAPLVGSTLFAAIFSGLVLGKFYNNRLNLPRSLIYHKLITGWTFIGTIFIFRVLANERGTNPAGWLGIAILWFMFCFFIWLGTHLPELEDIQSWLKIKK